MPNLEPATYLRAIGDDATTLVDAAERAGLDAPVPTCPDWVVADLLAHIGRVHRWAAGNAARRPDEGFWPGNEIEIPDVAVRPAWVREGARSLVAALDGPPDRPAWTWANSNNLGFWQRRQAQETAMHRVDAEVAAGDAPSIDAELAADGIDELLDIVGRTPWKPPPTGDGETLHFHCTDVDGEWLVRLVPDGIEVERVHAKGDVAARGSASDLLCWLQGRAPIDRLEVFGDAALLGRWREVATF
jgi:uncharacterized protein (TIGR03083 family)